MCFIDDWNPLPIDWQRASAVMKLRQTNLKDYPEFKELLDAYVESEQNKSMIEYSERMNKIKGQGKGDNWYIDKFEFFTTIVEYERGMYTVVIPYFLAKNTDWSKNPLYELWKKVVGLYLERIIPNEDKPNNN
jgi:hypothetical protein